MDRAWKTAVWSEHQLKRFDYGENSAHAIQIIDEPQHPQTFERNAQQLKSLRTEAEWSEWLLTVCAPVYDLTAPDHTVNLTGTLSSTSCRTLIDIDVSKHNQLGCC